LADEQDRQAAGRMGSRWAAWPSKAKRCG